MITVAWVQRHDDVPNRGYWDQGLLELITHGEVWNPVGEHEYNHVDSFEEIPPGEGAVVIVPARYHAEWDDVVWVNTQIGRLPWVLLILTSDEESLFPWKDLQHPNMVMWIMTPRSDKHAGFGGTFLGEYFNQDVPKEIALVASQAYSRRNDWYFSGQVTHARRSELQMAMMGQSGGQFYATRGFTQGYSRQEYLGYMADSKFALCPSGPATPDSFRLYEALEAGCIPIVDSNSPDGPDGYWDLVLPGRPFPVVKYWNEAPKIIRELLPDWEATANRVFSWWQQYKRDLVYQLTDDVQKLAQTSSNMDDMKNLVTVLIPTSPIKSHPDTRILDETIESVRQYDALKDCEIIIGCDGIRNQQQGYKRRYDEFKRRILWKANQEWDNVLVKIMDEHVHQANVTRWMLKDVKTPLVLFVEHDTPLTGDIPWDEVASACLDERVNLIRFHHEANILEPHKHMMLDPAQVQHCPLTRTVQWSQRPHLAKTTFYRDIIEKYFGTESRTMIEDVMHGVVWTTYAEDNDEGWEQFRLWMYTPEGDIKRSLHSDGRGDDVKYEMYYEYEDHVTPWGAPARTAGRVD